MNTKNEKLQLLCVFVYVRSDFCFKTAEHIILILWKSAHSRIRGKKKSKDCKKWASSLSVWSFHHSAQFNQTVNVFNVIGSYCKKISSKSLKNWTFFSPANTESMRSKQENGFVHTHHESKKVRDNFYSYSSHQQNAKIMFSNDQAAGHLRININSLLI